MNVPILRVPFDDDSARFIHEGIDQILASGHLTQGGQTARWEGAFAQFTGAKHAIACANGTAALAAAAITDDTPGIISTAISGWSTRTLSNT